MTLKEYKAKKMQDPEFARAYEEIQPEMEAIRGGHNHLFGSRKAY